MSDAKLEQEFLDIYERHADAIFRHCHFRLRDRDRAKDLTQETFLRIWQTLQRGTKVANMKAFLYKVATNLIIDASRRTAPASLEALEASGLEFGEDRSEQRQNFLDGARALERLAELDPKYRDAVYLRYVAELTPGEIATTLGATENTVSVWIHRGVEKLRRLLNYEQ